MGPISIAVQLLAATSSIQASQKAFSRITLEEKQTIVQYFENTDAELNYEILLDSECDAKYVMATNLEQYVIYDRESLCVVETGDDKPYSSENACKIYNTSVYGPRYLETDGTQIWEPSNSALKLVQATLGRRQMGLVMKK